MAACHLDGGCSLSLPLSLFLSLSVQRQSHPGFTGLEGDRGVLPTNLLPGTSPADPKDDLKSNLQFVNVIMEAQRQSGARIQSLPLFPLPPSHHPLSFPLLYSLSTTKRVHAFSCMKRSGACPFDFHNNKDPRFSLRKLLSSMSFCSSGTSFHLGFPFFPQQSEQGFPSRLVSVWSRTFALLVETACVP